MIELCETEINAVSGGFMRSYPGSEAPSIIAQLSARTNHGILTHILGRTS